MANFFSKQSDGPTPKIFCFKNIFKEEEEVIYHSRGLFGNELYEDISESNDPYLMKNEFFIDEEESGEFYLSVYRKNPAWLRKNNIPLSTERLFTLSYGHRLGYNAPLCDIQGYRLQRYYDDNTPTKAIYSYFRSLLLPPDDQVFNFRPGVASDEILVISFNREKLKQGKLDPGNFYIKIGNTYLIDSSDAAASPLLSEKPVYDLVEGVWDKGILRPIHSEQVPQSYGLVYPSLGLIVFNVVELRKMFIMPLRFQRRNSLGENVGPTYTTASRPSNPLEGTLYPQDIIGANFIDAPLGSGNYMIDIESNESSPKSRRAGFVRAQSADIYNGNNAARHFIIDNTSQGDPYNFIRFYTVFNMVNSTGVPVSGSVSNPFFFENVFLSFISGTQSQDITDSNKELIYSRFGKKNSNGAHNVTVDQAMTYFLRRYPGTMLANRRNLFYDFVFSGTPESQVTSAGFNNVIGEGYIANPYSFLFSQTMVAMPNSFPSTGSSLHSKTEASWGLYHQGMNNSLYYSPAYSYLKSRLTYPEHTNIPDASFWSSLNPWDHSTVSNSTSAKSIFYQRYFSPYPINDSLEFDRSLALPSQFTGNMNYGFFMLFRTLASLSNTVMEQVGYGFNETYNTLFMGRREVKKICKTYHLRIESDEFNFSNNSSYVKDASGNFYHLDFTREPKSFITTIGLYNDKYELLVVGKLPYPIEKKFGKEYIISIRLEF